MAWSEWKNVGDFAYQRNTNYSTFTMTTTSPGTGKLMIAISSQSVVALKVYKNGVQIGTITRSADKYGGDGVIDVTFNIGDAFSIDAPSANGTVSMFLVSI